MQYVSAAPSADRGCVFCSALAAGDDRAALILERRTDAFLILNAFPYASGHLMAVTTRHAGGLLDATPSELAEAMALVQVGMRALRAVYRPDGFNVGVNEGRAAGAGIADHVHMHLVPRWVGDTNFMPALGDTRVMPQHLDETYALLRPGFAS